MEGLDLNLRMAKTSLPHSRHTTRQQLIAAACIAASSVMYLLGVIQWERIVRPSQPSTASGQLSQGQLRAPRMLTFAPDVPPPQPSGDLAPVVYSVPTSQPVVFLTIDDGVYREPEAARLMAEAHVPASLFLTQQYVAETPGYFGHLAQRTQSVIENHTQTHKDLTTLSYDEQHREICGASDAFQRVYGKRPRLFRPPYGNYNADTQRAAHACGIGAVVIWRALVNGGAVHYQEGNALRQGDIVLMHFRAGFKQDLEAFVVAAKASGLQPQLLEEWLAP